MERIAHGRDGTYRSVRGNAFYGMAGSDGGALLATYRCYFYPPSNKIINTGFRIASKIPEPSTLLLGALAAVGLLVRRRRGEQGRFGPTSPGDLSCVALKKSQDNQERVATCPDVHFSSFEHNARKHPKKQPEWMLKIPLKITVGLNLVFGWTFTVCWLASSPATLSITYVMKLKTGTRLSMSSN